MHRFLFFITLLFTTHSLSAQVYINEFMASNSSVIKDPDFQNDADWIELYNDGSQPVNLNGYFLTDNFKTPLKWRIGNVVIPAKGYVVFWADGRDTLTTHTNFKLSADMEQIALVRSDFSMADSLSYGLQLPDISHGRNMNDLSLWGSFSIPTPGKENSTDFFTNSVLSEPQFSVRGGIYNSNQTVTLSTDQGGVIRYTTDGSQPTLASPLYTQPLDVTSTTVLRARIFKDNMLPGPVLTNTYFIREQMESRGLPVVSISSEPANFWNDSLGIYVQNFKPEWEIPVNIELFENNGADRAAFNEKAGIKINGLYSWQLPQKMLGVYFRKKYGSGNLGYSIFYDRQRSSFETFALRASGNDWSNTLMRDILGQQMTRLNTGLDISGWRWCTVFFNGQYMGIHNFREKIETDYIQQHYNMAAGTFDMIENEDYAECGDLTQYNELKALFSKDLSVQANFDAVAEKMDIENFTDLVITEVESGNSSIDHNVMAWKPKEGGKWKWIVMDIDRGFFSSTTNLISFSLSQTSFPFSRLMANAGYKAYFGKRLADHLYTSFDPSLMRRYIAEHHDAIQPEIDRHVARWLGTTSTYGNAMPSVTYWENEVTLLKTIVEERPVVLLNDLANYGYTGGTAQLTLSVWPADAATFKLNNFKLDVTSTSAPYLKGVDAKLTAIGKAGYRFSGWGKAPKHTLVARKSTWKYLDNGTDQGTAWRSENYNDAAWSQGAAEIGYGDGDETTKAGYGASSSSKYITTYFRHNFQATAADLQGTDYWIHLKRDDGAVVYINGVEVIRDNLTAGTVSYNTLATSATGDVSENAFYSYRIDKSMLKTGANVVAVEVHQSAATSSDMSFDMELCYYQPSDAGVVSTSEELPVNLTEDLSLIAMYESTGACIVPARITSSLTLHKACSPYLVRENVTVGSGATLTIEPGTEIWMSPESQLFIFGNMIAEGTVTDSISFRINPAYEGKGWGALNFWNCSGLSSLRHVYVADGTRGPIPQRVGVISSFHGNLNMDYLRIDHTLMNPIASRYADVNLTNSYIHSSYTSDLVNFKYGRARIENCVFEGNPEFDSDAIDYDGIENGVIRNTKILNTLGSNGDAIDIGEETRNVHIDSVIIVNAFDKGVSVGQRSSVVMNNCLLVNCNMGAGVKDSSDIYINHCIFSGNGYGVKCYEKNPGRTGGNARILNSVISNSYEKSYLADNASTIFFSNCLSDNDTLKQSANSLFANPLFIDPVGYNFGVQPGSPVVSGMGTGYVPFTMRPEAVICALYTDPLNTLKPEFVGIVNPSKAPMDLSGYSFDEGIVGVLPAGTLLLPGDTLFVTSDVTTGWQPGRQVVGWSEGRLANEGEGIRLLNQYGLVADFVSYSPSKGWPVSAFNTDAAIYLKSARLDNHFGSNWQAKSVAAGFSTPVNSGGLALVVAPNPVGHVAMLRGDFAEGAVGRVYSVTGELVKSFVATQGGYTSLPVGHLAPGIYLVKIGNRVAHLVKK